MTKIHNLKTGNMHVTTDAVIFDFDVVGICWALTRRIVEYSLIEATAAFTVAVHDLIVFGMIGTSFIQITSWRVVGSIPILTEGNCNCVNVDDLISRLTRVQCEDVIIDFVSRTTSSKSKHWATLSIGKYYRKRSRMCW